jgi:hypothetical protein
MAVDSTGSVRESTSGTWGAPVFIDYAHQLTSVSCATASFCVAVDNSGNALEWTGSSWSNPAVIDASNYLASISCSSSTFCEAVDQNGNAVQWNAAAWLAPAKIDGTSQLGSVSCYSSLFCVAVDQRGGFGDELTWNGTAWSAPSDIDPYTNLTSVSCESTTFCVAGDGSGRVITWNGTMWASPVGVLGDGLAVSCPTSSFCAAVDRFGLASHWNGTVWSASADIDGSNNLLSVSCSSAVACLAVDSAGNAVNWNGTVWSSPQAFNPLSAAARAVSCPSSTLCKAVDGAGSVLTWNGTVWSAPAEIDGSAPINAISCPSPTLCVAVDGSGNALKWSGGVWSAPASADPGRSLNAIDCLSSTFCMAGDQGGSSVTWNGSSWSSPVEYATDTIYSVACISATSCIAADYFGRALTWNGSSWSSGTQLDFEFGEHLTSISCPTASFCAGVDTGGNAFTFDGSSWTSWDGIDSGYSLNSISCPSSTFCTAVDNSGALLTWDGSSWSGPADGDGTNNLTSVSCSSSSFCAAVDSSGNALTASPPSPLPYTPVTPTRICDTRTAGPGIAANQCNAGDPGPLPGGYYMTLTVPGLPAGASAAVLNVTVADTDAPSYLTVWPAGTTQPTASNLNWTPGKVVPNLVEVAVGAGDQVSVFNAAGNADVIVDLEGYVAPVGTAGTGLFNALSPSRICDTRAAGGGVSANQCNGNGTGVGTLGVNGTRAIQVTGQGGVPASGVSAVVLNVTVADTSASSFLTVWSTGSAQPTASNLNWTPGMVVPNRVIVPVGPSGQVSVYNLTGAADVFVDVGGWYTDSSNPSASGASFVALSPSRVCDTRMAQPGVDGNQCNGNGTVAGTLGAGGTRGVAIENEGGVPASGVVAVVANVTVTDTTSPSYLTAWPNLTARPNASDLNWMAGETVPNLVVAKLGTDGAIDTFNLLGSTDVIVDVAGYYTG